MYIIKNYKRKFYAFSLSTIRIPKQGPSCRRSDVVWLILNYPKLLKIRHEVVVQLEGRVERLHLARKWVSKYFCVRIHFWQRCGSHVKITMGASMSTRGKNKMQTISINVYSYRAAKYIAPQLHY